MQSVSVKSLENKFTGEGLDRFSKIAELGGFGTVGTGEGGLDPDSTLDIGGVLDEENKGVSASNKRKIAELAGIAEPGPANATPAQELAKKHSRKALQKMATDAGLDGNSYTDETELAQAIIDAGGVSDGTK